MSKAIHDAARELMRTTKGEVSSVTEAARALTKQSGLDSGLALGLAEVNVLARLRGRAVVVVVKPIYPPHDPEDPHCGCFRCEETRRSEDERPEPFDVRETDEWRYGVSDKDF